jgi:transposase
MDILTDRHQISRLEVVDTGRRRRWSESEKLRIVEESLSVSRQASATARRHGISTTLLFAWRKAYREGRLAAVYGCVPAVVAPEEAASEQLAGDLAASSPDPKCDRGDCGRMEIVLPSGCRVIVGSDVDRAALRHVLDVLGRS